MLGQRGASVAVTSAMPEWPADSGSAPHAAASAATMPNDSGNVHGITCASQAGSSIGQVVVLEPAGEVDPRGRLAGRRRAHVVAHASSRNAFR